MIIENGIVYKITNIGSITIKQALKNEFRSVIRGLEKSSLNIGEDTNILLQLQRYDLDQGKYLDCNKSMDIDYSINSEVLVQTTNTLGKALVKFTADTPCVKMLRVGRDMRQITFN